jgi:DNA-binding CsgD family transcriptional regulator
MPLAARLHHNHVKKIYARLDVHSEREVFEMIQRLTTPQFP